MSDLYERLRARQLGGETSEQAPVASAVDRAPDGWVWVAPLVARRRLRFGLETGLARFLEPILNLDDWQGWLSFDTETTGLSGGAGTVPFLVGWAQLVPGSPPEVEVSQWFLRDLPGEPQFIEALDAEFQAAPGLVSFNGASYDLPLLRSRWALQGLTFPEKPHRDDLHPARRLWKRLLESCRLSRLEQTVLGLHRIDDVPGSLVPTLWFDYLRSGAAADFVTPLEGVLRHHAQDVYSLLCLDLLLASLVKAPNHARWQPTFGPFPQRSSMARLAPEGLLHPDLGRNTPVDFWGHLALQHGDAAAGSLADAWEQNPTEAVGLAWADFLKRRRDPRAVVVWTHLWESQNSYGALEELLKWLEHRDRSESARREALERIAAALRAPFVPRTWVESLNRRRLRLEAKAGAAPSHPSEDDGLPRPPAANR